MRRRALLLGLVLTTNGMVRAEKADHLQPIGLTGNYCTVDQKDKNNQVSVCKGNVVITQGTLEAHGDTATVHENSSGEQVYTLLGNPVQFKQRLDGPHGWMEGHGNKIVYTTTNSQAVMTGDAWVKTDSRQLTSEVLQYNTITSDTTASSTDSGGHHGVRLIFAPKPKNDKGENQ